MEPPVHSKEQIILYAGPQIEKVARFRATKSKSLKMRNKKSVSPFRTHRWSEWRDLNSRPLDPQSSALPTALHPDILFFRISRGQLVYINTAY